MKYIFVDLEVIASNGINSLEKVIEKIEPLASNKYLSKITKLYSNGLIREDEYRLLLEESYDYKDRVLGEVDKHYKNVINFKEIYEINDLNQAMYDYINLLSTAKLGYTIYIIFYYNTEREYNEKMEVCKKFFPNCEAMGIKFYEEDYQKDYLRKRTNKAEYIKNELKLNDLTCCLLIDKSVKSCDEWNELKGISQLQFNYLDSSNDKGNQLSK